MANPVFPPIRSEPLINPVTGEITIRYAEYFEQVSQTIVGNDDTINDELDAINNELDDIDLRIDGIDARIDAIDIRLNAMDDRMDAQDLRMNAFDLEFENAFQLISENQT